jgi:IPTL-CTERM motif
MSWRNRIVAILAATAALSSLPSAAQTLYGATGAGATSNLYTISTITGAATVVGPIGQGVTGMAFNGTMYGVTTGPSACSRCLISINTTTGAGTVIGPLGLTISELEFGANGTLYGWSESSDELASINTTTGAATTIPGSGLNTFGDGMALLGGVMYVMPEGDNSTYYTVNTTTGTTTLAGTLTNSPNGTGAAVSAAATNPATNVVFAGINNFNVAPSFLVTVNMATGVITNVGTTVTGIDALAFGPLAGPAAAVPTLSEWMLAALALLLLAVAAVRLRRD